MTKVYRARQAFIEEAREELLPELENSLLELGSDPLDKDLINRVFRALHTLKGSGAMFGFDRLSELAHEIESVFDSIRNGQTAVDNQLVELTLTAKDQMQRLVDDPESVTSATITDLMAAFQKALPVSREGQDPMDGPETTPGNDRDNTWKAWHIRFQPQAGLFATGNNPLYLLDELYGLGTVRAVAHLAEVPPLEQLDPEACYAWWDILLATDQPFNTIKDVFIFVENECRLTIELIADNIQYGREETAFEQLAPFLSGNKDADIKATRDLFSRLSPAANASTGPESSPSANDQPAPGSPTGQAQGSNHHPAKTISSMRVQAAKLDQLVNLVGELVIAQTRLSRLADQKKDTTLIEIAEMIERLSNDLRENTLDIRMMPIGSSFGKFKRVVWDLSSRKNKEVDLITEGADTELDKTVIERLDDPLVHLLRNSIDHGIETPAERKAAGKAGRGKIVFSAEHSGGNVVITISDDGRGIDPDIIKARAVEKGLLAPEASPTEQELLNLIFEPGFSTAAEVSDLSGRGVGMDVVKQNIAALRGKVRVTSQKGLGSEVRITLPLTLAIIDGLRIRIGRENFIIPLTVVSECLELDQEQTGNGPRNRQHNLINLRDQLVPFLSLRQWFSINGQRPDKEQVVIVAADKKLVGLIVDEVIGLQQAVIKGLGEAHQDIPGVSGATIQGDGSLALILDVEPLVQRAQEQSTNRSG
ncbi:MAG: chemotaxis protein CheA [Desulfosudaceae bacterium]